MARFNRTGPRRQTVWAGFPDAAGGVTTMPGMASLAAGTPQIVSRGVHSAVVLATTTGADEPYTITRMIANILCQLDSVAADVFATVALGCYIASAEAVAAGVASLWSAEDDPGRSWLYYETFQVRSPKASTIEGAAGVNAYRAHIDTRGQRKVTQGELPVWVAESDSQAVVIGLVGRYLLKLV